MCLQECLKQVDAKEICCFFFSHPSYYFDDQLVFLRVSMCTSSDAVVSAVTDMVTLDGLHDEKGRREAIDRCVRLAHAFLFDGNFSCFLLTVLWPLLFLFPSIFSVSPIVETICPITFDTSRHKYTLFNDNHLLRHITFSRWHCGHF